MKLLICDIETFKEYILLSFWDPETDEWREFEISRYGSDVDAFVKFYTSTPCDYLVFFNGIAFDQQVLEWINRNHQRWFDLPPSEVTARIYYYSQEVIDKSKYKIRQDFEERHFTVPQLDLFKIWHYDRDQRSTGLKKLEFSMDMESIEEIPYPHWKEDLSLEEMKEIKSYCRNDIKATYKFYQYTIGNCEHFIYKGDDKIDLRLTLQEEYNLDSVNISDSKIGDSIIRKEYCRASGLMESELPKKGFFRKKVPISKCIAPYISFKTQELQDFLTKIRAQGLEQGEDFSEILRYAGQVYDFKKGGLHNRIKGQYFRSDEKMIVKDLDARGYYPRIMINCGYFPQHLNKNAFIKALQAIVGRREELKPLAKADRKVKGIVQGLKLAANSVFGKTSDMYSWMFDRLCTMQTTITGELSLLMLIEALELEGIKTIMANTDGITLYMERSQESKLQEICKWWQVITDHVLEEAEFEFIAFSTVNDYIARKMDGEIKVKGDFLTDSELHGNKSRRVVRIALNDYFLKGTAVEDTIRNHPNIYDFTIGVKSSDNYHYEITSTTESRKPLRKMVRYFISQEGEILYKVKNPDSEAKGPREAHCESVAKVNGEYQPVVTYFNRYFSVEDYGIDFHYYILQAKSIIDKIDPARPESRKDNQLNLF